MKTLVYILLLSLNFGFIRGQTESIIFDFSGDSFDLTYDSLYESLYANRKPDTLEFNDGANIYQVIEFQRFRPDTTINFNSSSYSFEADTVNVILEYPIYPKKKKELRFYLADTMFNADDPAIYQIEKTNSIEISYAKSYSLDPNTFFETIREVERLVKFQEIKITDVVPVFYGNKMATMMIENVDKEDFKDIDFVSVDFYLSKGNQSMRYSIIFEE